MTQRNSSERRDMLDARRRGQLMRIPGLRIMHRKPRTWPSNRPYNPEGDFVPLPASVRKKIYGETKRKIYK